MVLNKYFHPQRKAWIQTKAKNLRQILNLIAPCLASGALSYCKLQQTGSCLWPCQLQPTSLDLALPTACSFPWQMFYTPIISSILRSPFCDFIFNFMHSLSVLPHIAWHLSPSSEVSTEASVTLLDPAYLQNHFHMDDPKICNQLK